jgi:hypothetical protein
MNMSIVSISDAARLTGKNRRTLQRHIKSGQLSATQQSDGQPGIQIVELIRVYGEIRQDSLTPEPEKSTTPPPPVIDERDIEIAKLRAELAGKNELLIAKEELIESQKETISQQKVALLTFNKLAEPEKPAPKKSFFKRIFSSSDNP